MKIKYKTQQKRIFRDIWISRKKTNYHHYILFRIFRSQGDSWFICKIKGVIYFLRFLFFSWTNHDLVIHNYVQFIPSSLEFVLHTAILPAAFIEAIISNRTIKIKQTMRSMTVFIICYALWCLVCFHVNGKWPYRNDIFIWSVLWFELKSILKFKFIINIYAAAYTLQ